MHYYQFNIADYQSHTKHLTPIEDICYRRLLDWQYLHEKPIPNDIKSMCRLLMLREYQTDVEQVLNEFFILVEDGWVNNRAFIEIEQFHDKSKKASEAGKASAMKRSLNKKSTNNQANNINKEQAFNVRSTDVQPTINQEPLTINQEPYNPPIPPTEEQKKTKEQKTESQSDDCSVRVPESNFDIFWKHYPKKIGKDAARKAFEKKAKPPKETLEKIINALSWQRESEQWKKEGGNYIPNPATYLNQGRWQDERPHPTHHPPQPKNKRFDPINAINGGDGYGNAREQENRIIDIGGGVAEEEQQRHLGYRPSF